MNRRRRIAAQASVLALCMSWAAVTAHAATTLNLTDTVVSPSSGSYSVIPVGPSNGTINPTLTLSLGNAFNGAAQAATGVHFDLTAGTAYNTTPWNFQDDYVFSTSGATIYTATIALPSVTQNGTTTGITDLQARIVYATYMGNPVNGAPTVGAPVGGTLVDAWQNIDPNGTFSITMPTGFAAGDYVLQIRGLAADAGGSYGGTIAFAPAAVPLPASFPLLVGGLVLLGRAGAGRRGWRLPTAAFASACG